MHEGLAEPHVGHDGGCGIDELGPHLHLCLHVDLDPASSPAVLELLALLERNALAERDEDLAGQNVRDEGSVIRDQAHLDFVDLGPAERVTVEGSQD